MDVQQNNLASKNAEIEVGKAIVAILAAGLSPDKTEEILAKLADKNCDLNAIQMEIKQLQQSKKQEVQNQSGQQAQSIGESYSEKMILYVEAYEKSGAEWDSIVNEGIGGFFRNVKDAVKGVTDEFRGNRREKSNNKFYYQINQEIRGVSRDIAEMCEDLKTMGVNLDTHPELKAKIDDLIGVQNGIIGNTGAEMGNIQKMRYGAGKMIAGAAYNAAAFAMLGHVLPALNNPFAKGAMRGAAASVLRDLRTGKFYTQGKDGKDKIDVKGIVRRMAAGAAIGGAVQFGMQKAMEELGFQSPTNNELRELSDEPYSEAELERYGAGSKSYETVVNIKAKAILNDVHNGTKVIVGNGGVVNDGLLTGIRSDPVFGSWLVRHPDKLKALRDILKNAHNEDPTVDAAKTFKMLANAIKNNETNFDTGLENIQQYIQHGQSLTDDQQREFIRSMAGAMGN